MNADKTVLILRNPDMDLPEDYLKRVLADYDTNGGYAIQTDNDGTPTLVTDRMDTGVNLEAVQDLLKAYASSRILLAFAKLGKVEENFLQPFDFSMPGDPDPLMAFGIEGEFPTLVEAGTTQEANLANKFILPNFNKFLKLSEGNLDNFINELKDGTFVDNLLIRVGERGAFCFLPPLGDAIWLGKNKLGSTFPWGTVSNTLGYTETPAQTAPVTADKPKTGWWSGKGPKLPVAEEPVVPKPAEAPIPGPLNIPAATPDTKINPPAPAENPPADVDMTAPPAGHYETVPKGLSNKDRKAFIRRVTGCGNNLPEGSEQPGFRYWVVDYPKRPKNLNELKDQLTLQPKDMRSSEPPKVVHPTHGAEIAEVNSMVLSAQEKSDVETTLLKIMDRQGKGIPNPIEIQKKEQSYPKFSTTFGVTTTQINGWLPVDIETFMKSNGKAAFHLFLEYRRRDIEHEQTIPKAVVTETSPEPTTVEQPKKVANAGWSWGK